MAMLLRVLTETDLRACLDMPRAIQAMRHAFGQISSGRARIPVRTPVEGGGGVLLAMPGRLADPPALGMKLVSVFPGNRDRGRSAIHAVVVLVEPETGVPAAIMDGEWLTALRTGAGSGLATDLLARPDSSVLGVIGAGPQARTQIEAVRSVRPIEQVRVHSRSLRSAETLAAELEGVVATVPGSAADTVRGADVVVTATDASDPVFPAGAVGFGVHVNAVGGYRPDMQELPSGLMERARVFVDQVDAALAEAGDVIVPISEGRLRSEALAELGSLVLGQVEGRTSADQVTVFKSVGNAAQDLAVAREALAVAEREGLGTIVG